MPKTVAIIGAGLAGSACANAFAHAGFNVTVFERGAAPASGASGVPLAMFAPSVSADDAPHSRLLRRGVHVLLDELRRLTEQGLLVEGKDWALTGVLERCLRGDKKLPSTWLEPQDAPTLQSRVLVQSKPAPSASPSSALTQVLAHGAAGWVQPDRLIAAWLNHTSISTQTNTPIRDAADVQLSSHDLVVVACGYQTAELVPCLKSQLQPIRGQVEWGRAQGSGAAINGMGHWIQSPERWLAGATFQRDDAQLLPRARDVDLNFGKLAALRPELAKPELARLRGVSQSWVGVRTAQKNRTPLVIQPYPLEHAKLWVCAALGSRGLSLAALCARELLAHHLRS